MKRREKTVWFKKKRRGKIRNTVKSKSEVRTGIIKARRGRTSLLTAEQSKNTLQPRNKGYKKINGKFHRAQAIGGYKMLTILRQCKS